MSQSTLPSIDFAQVAARADLPAMLRAEGIDVRRGLAFCPFHPNTNTPALSIFQGDDCWRFKCHGCDAQGTALDWLMLRDNLTLAEAARRLDPTIPGPGGSHSPTRRPTPQSPPPARTKPAPLWQDPEWQAAITELVVEAEDNLKSKQGRDAMEWLHRRGLEDHVISRFRLGFLPSGGYTSAAPRKDGSFGPLGHIRGITIPWAAPGSHYALHLPEPDKRQPEDVPVWVGLNIRCLAADVDGPRPDGMSKCRAVEGSERGHMYPWPDLLPTQPILPAMLVEGEFDALIAWQEACWMVHVGTVGGANGSPTDSALAYLACCPWWLVATDHDEAGAKAAWGWSERSPHKARRAMLPGGHKDINDFHIAGGNVLEWVTSEIHRLKPDRS